MNKHQYLFAALLAMAVSGTLWAQDPIFTQFMNNKLYLNPAFAGSTPYGAEFSLNSRQQWFNVPGPNQGPAGQGLAYVPVYGTYRFNQASIQTYCANKGVGTALQVRRSSEGEGVLNSNSATFYLSQTQSIWQPRNGRSSRGFLGLHVRGIQATAGLSMGIAQRTIDWSSLRFSSQYHPMLGLYRDQPMLAPLNDRSNVYIDPSMGVRIKSMFGDKTFAKTTTLSAGFAVFHLVRPVETFFSLNHKIPRRYNGFVQLTYFKSGQRRKNNPLFTTIGMVYDHQAPLSTMSLNLGQQIYGGLVGNLGLRRRNFWELNTESDAAYLALNFLAGETQMGLSYDFTISSLSQVRTSGTLEFSLVQPLQGRSGCFNLPRWMGGRPGGRRRGPGFSRDYNCVDSELMRIRPRDFVNFLP